MRTRRKCADDVSGGSESSGTSGADRRAARIAFAALRAASLRSCQKPSEIERPANPTARMLRSHFRRVTREISQHHEDDVRYGLRLTPKISGHTDPRLSRKRPRNKRNVRRRVSYATNFFGDPHARNYRNARNRNTVLTKHPQPLYSMAFNLRC